MTKQSFLEVKAGSKKSDLTDKVETSSSNKVKLGLKLTATMKAIAKL